MNFDSQLNLAWLWSVKDASNAYHGDVYDVGERKRREIKFSPDSKEVDRATREFEKTKKIQRIENNGSF